MSEGAPPDVIEIGTDVLANERVFRRAVMEACQPIIIRGAVSNWPVVRAAQTSLEALRAYLARFAMSRRAEAFVGDSVIAGRYTYTDRLDGFNFERVEMDLLGAFDQIVANAGRAGSPTVYMGSAETEAFLPGFSAENRTPAVPARIGPRIWIGNASNISCHNDTFDNIACVIAGQRTFTLYPPDAVADLYVGPVDYTMAGRPISLASGAVGQEARYPRFAGAERRASVARLMPGDALYLPKLWWHQVEATAPVNVLINYWWDGWSIGPDAPDTTMLLAMIAIAERPPAERAAWKAMFDHYVFRSEGHPLAHMPEARHGILGPLRDGNYGLIRARVMQLLRDI
ncbi:cupin-like domain-containing protein [Sphingomonas sp. QA11]|uniref:cupin-like domain-containing protein n=1 Tax=Sphingomonas sp. QA11 TaxID=2950605 RepID=UPI00234A3D20|nr:cupin-like domain-containing protein [Sphingomonas sp. QA11]WCM25132.1 cupin-like domain-containing protein [Sphingomonas sp. QA11]